MSAATQVPTDRSLEPALPEEAPPEESPVRSWEGLEERWQLDTSEAEPVYLLKGRNGSRMRMTASARQLLSLRSSGVTSEAIAEALRAAGKEISAEQLEERYQQLCERIEGIEERANDNPMGFWFRIRLLPEAAVVAIASKLRWAFAPRWVPILLAVLVAGLVSLFVLPPPHHFDAAGFWIGYAFLLLSVLIHEFGHASACAYFGARPSEIGATLYLIYPALYSDVSAAWRLRRMQRVAVDLAGMYFQLLTGAVYMAAYGFSGWRPFRVAYLMILGGMVFSLNPIFRFDGYWVVADALGVTNLGRQPTRVVRHWLRRFRRQPSEPLPWPLKVTATLAVYSVLSFSVWGLFLWMMGPRAWSLVAALPAHVTAFVRGEPGAGLGSLLMSTFMTVVMVFILWRVARSMVIQPLLGIVQRLRHRRPRPPESAAEEVMS